jgi:hypothetical protein
MLHLLLALVCIYLVIGLIGRRATFLLLGLGASGFIAMFIYVTVAHR